MNSGFHGHNQPRKVNMEPIAVVVYSTDPIIYTGLSAILHSNANVHVLGDQHIADADVAVVAANVVDNETMTTLREVAGRSSARSVLISNEIPLAELSTLAKYGIVTILPRCSATTEGRLIKAVLTAAQESRLPASRNLPRLQAQLRQKRRGALWPNELDAVNLDRQEKILLRLISEGHTTDEIASKMDCSKSAIYLGIRRILSQLGVHNRSEAVGHAMRIGQLDPD
ncbi:LuxR C-terminal-related transcriptional regulator [Kutzneria sp. NPDC052558]|uniref:helix-turn-helix transcriptional regulator n=1 Tax=Kutzneria sp. NPDC052558 TaxID=3364121 RepID=UPI0037C77B77